MAVKQRTYKCRQCGTKTLHQRETFSMPWGCLLTILTGGLFIPIWIIVDLFGMFRPWRCQNCGKAKTI